MRLKTYRSCATGMAMIAMAVAVSSFAAEKATQKEAARRSADDAIRQALRKEVTLWYKSVPLTAVADDLEFKLGVPVRLDAVGLRQAGIDSTTEVSFVISKCSAKSAVFHLLRPLDLMAITEHETLWITSPQVAESRLKTKVYDVADLVSSAGDSDEEPSEFSALIEVIQTAVDPRLWDENGGSGSIREFKGAGIKAIVVSQTENAHDELADLLEQLRAIRAAHSGKSGASLQEPTPQAVIEPVSASAIGPTISVAESAILAALDKPVTLQLHEASLSQSVRDLAKAASVTILVDRKGSFEPDLKSQRVTLEASGRSLRAVLDELARAFGIAWTCHGESLLLLSEAEAERMVIGRVYDLGDLPACRNQRGEGVPDYARMKDMITRTIDAKSWEDAGGLGAIKEYDQPGIHGIVVSQTWKAHLEIAALLVKLRQLRGPRLSAEAIRKLPRQAPAPEVAGEMPSAPVSTDPRRDAVVAANNEFAADLYARLGGENRIFSPSSLATVLAMVHAGARGKTAEEMAKALHFAGPAEDVGRGSQSLRVTLPKGDQPSCTLTVVNRLWGQRDYGFLATFLATTRERFGAELADVDFSQPADACRLINVWAHKQTDGKIKQIVEPSSISPQTRLIATNAVYFKGLWSDPFKKDATLMAPFYPADGGEATAPLMHQLTHCRYASFGNLKVLEKPYRGGEIALLVLLPEKGRSALEDLEKALSAEKLGEWTSSLRTETVDVRLPRFRLEAAIPLNSALASLGMVRVFDRRLAELAGINGGKEPLWLDWVLQQAYIQVDEEGTEAAAVTTGGMGGGFAGPRPKIKVFHADHPFVFLVRDTRTGCILFMGRLAKPGQ